MDITIRINCDNAAFEANAGAEVCAILKMLAMNMNGCATLDDFNKELLRDFNGNVVGRVEVTK